MTLPAFIHEQRHLRSLLAVVQALSLARDLKTVMTIGARAARELTAADGASFVLREDERCNYADEDASAPLWKGQTFPIDTCISGWTMLHREPAVIEHIDADPRILMDAYRPTFVKSLAVVPIGTAEPLGAIEVYWATGRRATVTDIALLQALADSAAGAVENVQLIEGLRRSAASERAARNDAETANRLKDELLAAAAHQLRTPLNAMRGWTYMLREGELDAAASRRAIDSLDRNARAQDQLVQDLLDVSRIINGKLQLKLERVNPNTVIERAVDEARSSAESKGVRIDFLSAAATGTIIGDPSRLQQVFWNLISNSIKFTPAGGRVQILIEQTTSHANVSVTDTGAGIERDFLPYLFERFRQTDRSQSRHYPGSGFGLAIVRNLVELHGGTVAADSAGTDLGATFTVSLPVHGTSEVLSIGHNDE